MKAKVHIRPAQYGHNLIVAQVDGGTVGQCLDHLVRQFPGIEKDLFDEDGKLLGYINIFVNGESAYPEDLAKPVKEADEIYIVPMFAGG